ncbi:hypothetical protein [Henriciella sp.]|uniref:hypothetical protein n=1 Tax=Henriciella sp. TaxID=1968823 RepID=UPI002626F9A2|nr:hypothetical protein [Henriciella sp.]
MTIETDKRLAGPFTGNGATTAFTFDYRVFAAGDVTVFTRDGDTDTTLTEDVDYTVTLNADQDDSPGGTVTFGTAPASGVTLYVESSVPYTQSVAVSNAGGFYPEVVNKAFDRAVALTQQNKKRLDRALVMRPGETALPSISRDKFEDGMPYLDTATGKWKKLVTTGIASILPYLDEIEDVAEAIENGEISDLLDGQVAKVDYLSDLQDFANTDKKTAVMTGRTETGRGGGVVIFHEGDMSSKVSADEVTAGEGDGGEWIARASDKSGASGAWQKTIYFNKRRSIEDYGGIEGAGVSLAAAEVNARALTVMGRRAGDIYIPKGVWRVPSAVELVSSGIFLCGPGKLLLGGADAVSAGDSIITATKGNFRCEVSEIEAEKRVTGLRVDCADADQERFWFEGTKFTNVFYAINSSTSPERIGDLAMIDCEAIAWDGDNAGAFLAKYADGVKMRGLTTYGGQGTAMIGLADCANYIIDECRQHGIVAGSTGAESGIQIEDYAETEGRISNCECDDDIWVDDSQQVEISNCKARRARITVSGSDPGNLIQPNKIHFHGGRYGQISVGSLGTPGAQRIQAQFTDLQLDPATAEVLGSSVSSSISCSGSYVGDIVFDRVREISEATTYATSFTRNASANYRYSGCNFLTKPHNVSGTGGVVEEIKPESNPIFTNSPVELGFGSTYSPSGTGGAAWTTFALAQTTDRNAEWDDTGRTFTPNKTGFYKIDGILRWVPSASGVEFRLRVYNVTDGAEVMQLVDLNAPASAGLAFPVSAPPIHMVKDKDYRFEYILTGGTADFSPGTSVSRISISPA